MTRIVHCPGCKVLLVEPSAGIAIYQCGNCFKVLYAKHAIQSSLQPDHVGTPPLYTQRRSDHDQLPPLASADHELHQQEHEGRLYTPRPPSARQPNGQSQSKPSSLLLLQDVRRLARDAFPVGFAQQQESVFQNSTKSEFEFERRLSTTITTTTSDGDSFKQQADYAGSDYHSTLEELDGGSSSSRSPVSDCFPRMIHKDLDKQLLTTTTSKSRTVSTSPRLAGVQRHHLGNGFAFGRSTSMASESDSSASSSSLKEQNSQLVQGASSSSSHKNYPPLDLPYVWCQHCKMLLEVPCNLPPSNRPVQKLRCGACQRISRFAVHDRFTSESGQNHNVSSWTTSTASSTATPRKHASRPHDGMLQLDVLTSVSPGGRGSAPGSFHHAAAHEVSHCFAVSGDVKGYDSAPEFQTSYSVASHDDDQQRLHHHARSESGTSSTNGQSLPMAPCLHELFGYESPSQFLHKQHGSDVKAASDRGGSRGLKGLLLKSIHDKLHAVSVQRSIHVTVNGKLIPDELVRRAENQAGSIHPGSYWYDTRAGFWGVMGGPCLGIIPPCIQEFDHPMQLGCAGGKTGIVVNGRELHQQDLDVLIKRGLPPTSNTAYTIDIDGTVIDLASENQIVSLGRLAPTMEKRGVGFGMYPLTSGGL